MTCLICVPTVLNVHLELARLVQAGGGRALVVGGAVRDAALGTPAYDLDVEVYGISPTNLEALLDKRFGVDRIGQAFGILELKGLPIDVSLPRRESKAGLGHCGFEVFTDLFMSVTDAMARRDFTIDSVGLYPLTDELLDPFGGLADLASRTLRHTSAAFPDDPLRVLRAMQFAARMQRELC